MDEEKWPRESSWAKWWEDRSSNLQTARTSQNKIIRWKWEAEETQAFPIHRMLPTHLRGWYNPKPNPVQRVKAKTCQPDALKSLGTPVPSTGGRRQHRRRRREWPLQSQDAPAHLPHSPSSKAKTDGNTANKSLNTRKPGQRGSSGKIGIMWASERITAPDCKTLKERSHESTIILKIKKRRKHSPPLEVTSLSQILTLMKDN